MPRSKPTFEEEIDNLVEWGGDARCRRYDPKIFDTSYTRKGKLKSADANERAARVCLDCPVMIDCLIHAVFFDIQTGVWGGLTPEERTEWAEREGMAA